jgi:CBS domain-containing membrane protein
VDWVQTMGPVLLGSGLLVGIGILWNSAVGRTYPFRQPAQPGPHGTTDPTPEARIGLDPVALAAILEEYRQSANLGVADLARLVGAAEQAAAARRMEGFTAADIMPLAQVADLFRTRGFTSLPVVSDGHLLGMIFQIDLIRRAREDAFRQHQSLIRAFAHLIDNHRKRPPKAGEIMETGTPRITPETPVGAILPLLSDGGAEAVAVVDGPRVVGIVTRTDLVSALAQRLALRPG